METNTTNNNDTDLLLARAAEVRAALLEMLAVVGDECDEDGTPTSLRFQTVVAALAFFDEMGDADWSDPEVAPDL